MKRTLLISTICLFIFYSPSVTQYINEWNRIDTKITHQFSSRSYRQVDWSPDSSIIYIESNYKVRCSNDDGETFNEVFTINPEYKKNFYPNALAHPKKGMTIIVGDSVPNQNNPGYRFGTIFITKNDFTDTRKITLDSNSMLTEVSMYDTTEGFIVKITLSSTFTDNSKVSDSILVTRDGGQSWQSELLPVKSYTYTTRAFSFGKGCFIIFCNEFTKAADRILMKTTDYGYTWEVIRGLPPRASGISFGDINHAYTISEIKYGNGMYIGNIHKSVDGGNSWQSCESINNAEFPPDFYDISFFDKDNGIAVGFGIYNIGNILTTTDGGLTWVEGSNPESFYFFEFTFLAVKYHSKNHAILFSNGFIYKTTGKTKLRCPNFITRTGENKTTAFVQWEKITGADDYRLQVAEVNRGEGFGYSVFDKPLYLDTTVTKTSLSLNNLKYAKYYGLRIRSQNSGDTSEWSGMYRFLTTYRPTQLLSPVCMFPIGGKFYIPQDVTIYWKKSDGADYYQLQLSNNPYFINNKDFPLVTYDKIADSAYKLTNLKLNTLYYWRLKAFNQQDSSEWSSALYGASSFVTGTLDVSVRDEIDMRAGLKFYPNPVKDYIKIENCDIAGKELIRIYNLQGVMVLETACEEIIDLSFLPRGIYLLTAGDRRLKFIKY